LRWVGRDAQAIWASLLGERERKVYSLFHTTYSLSPTTDSHTASKSSEKGDMIMQLVKERKGKKTVEKGETN
jgi:hypothetical protein